MHEFQARDLFRTYAIDFPRGIIATTGDEAFFAAETLGCPVVVKAQVLVGKRGKAGGVKRARTPEEARNATKQILSLTIGEYRVQRVLVAQALDIQQEFYIALATDRKIKSIVCMVSAQGGIDIEETARQDPAKITTIPLPLSSFGVLAPHLLEPVFGVHATAASELATKLFTLMCDNDLSLVEINPLVLTKDNKLIAADAKVSIDDNALYKHKDLEALRNPEEYTADEKAALEAHLTYVSLDGNIGCMVNGAGLAMATMDLIHLYGGHAANFLDVGGSSNPDKVLRAFKILAANPQVKVLLVNIFGGITRCDDIARGIIMARNSLHLRLPLVIRLTGTNEEAGRKLLMESGIVALTDMTDAIKQAVHLERSLT